MAVDNSGAEVMALVAFVYHLVGILLIVLGVLVFLGNWKIIAGMDDETIKKFPDPVKMGRWAGTLLATLGVITVVTPFFEPIIPALYLFTGHAALTLVVAGVLIAMLQKLQKQ